MARLPRAIAAAPSATCGRCSRTASSARDVIGASAADLGVRGADVEPFLYATALALPGWAGMFSRLERHPEDHRGGPPTTLVDFLAVRLLLERRAVERACRALGVDSDWTRLRARMPAVAPLRPVLAASLLWHVAKAAAMTADRCRRSTMTRSPDSGPNAWRVPTSSVAGSCMKPTSARYRRSILDALAARRVLPQEPARDRPRAQFVFCIDEREESIRRAIEEQHPDYITFGAAGFFGVAIDYQGLYDREPAAHCPVVVTPAHEVYEQPVYTDLGWHAQRQHLRNAWLGWERRTADVSRTLSGGAGMSFLVGPISALRTIARVVAPRASRRIGDGVKSRLAPRPATRLSTLRVDAAPVPLERGKPVGFSLGESIDRVTATLTNLGLVSDFAPIVVILGHGSTSLNNPHESAHDCGACGGRRGGANARLFAEMANRPDVREGVRTRGIDIPADTWFVGAPA